jgi:hypothetical protein
MRAIEGSLIAALLMSVSPAHAGPCTAQIAQVKQQIDASNVDAAGGPSAPQTIRAQLGRQPTPATVEGAEHEANAFARAALNHVRRADDAGNAVVCRQALVQLKNLYGLP